MLVGTSTALERKRRYGRIRSSSIGLDSLNKTKNRCSQCSRRVGRRVSLKPVMLASVVKLLYFVTFIHCEVFSGKRSIASSKVCSPECAI
jgi:hypothetical protein